MADRTQTDELNTFNEVWNIIDGLIRFDADSRMMNPPDRRHVFRLR